jgi:LytS/YehU family sensor histidine kinase
LGAVLGFGIVSFLLGRLVGFSMIGERLSLAITIVIALLITAFLGLAGELHRERELRQRVAAEAAARAQVAALQAQINPHFFFNTLNTLSALVDTDPGRARNLIQSLAGMFRYSLACSQNGLARLEDEVRFVEDYLALEKARLGERLQVTWTAARDLAGVRVPGLALQPLVENAVRHGIARRLAPGRLEISVSREAGAVRLRVSNETEPSDGAPDLSETRLFQDGHALSILRRRLAAEYGERAALRLWAEAPERVVAELTIPAAAGEAAAR